MKEASPAGAAATVESKTHALARTTSLIALVVQQVALVLLIRYSRTREQPGTNDSSSAASYLISTAVVSAEVGKLLLNLLLEIVSTTYFNDNSKEPVSPGSLWNELFSRDSWRLLVPAFLYVVQNNLLFVALENLSVPLYQVTNQGKLLTTAFCSRWLLKKNISGMQYVSLLLLAAGVAVVQLSSLSSKTGVGEGDAAAVERNQMIGLVAVISSCFTSGFAGVYFEKVLKGSSGGQEKTSVYMRNCQLAVFSIVLALVPVLTKDYAIIAEKGFFAGYDATVWLVIFCQMMTGLIVALVMKYANTILKGFCTSVAVVVATVLSIWLFGTRVDEWFALGAIMVVGAVQLYSKYPPNAKAVLTPATATPPESRRGPRKIYIAVVAMCVVVGMAREMQFGFSSSYILAPLEANTASASDSNTTGQPPDTTETPPALPLLKTKEQLLKAVVSRLNERGVPYFIMYGTLLGQMRDGGLIPHENDIDALLHIQHAPEFVAALRNLTNIYGNVVVRDWSFLGIVQVTTDPQHAKIHSPTKPRPDYLLMDTYVFNRTKGLVVEKWNKLIFNETQFYPAQTMNLYLNETHENITVQVPNQPSVIIDKLYGPDWIIPYNDNRGKHRKSPYCGAGTMFGLVWKNCY